MTRRVTATMMKRTNPTTYSGVIFLRSGNPKNVSPRSCIWRTTASLVAAKDACPSATPSFALTRESVCGFRARSRARSRRRKVRRATTDAAWRARRRAPSASGLPPHSAGVSYLPREGYNAARFGACEPLIWVRCMTRRDFESKASRRCMVVRLSQSTRSPRVHLWRYTADSA